MIRIILTLASLISAMTFFGQSGNRSLVLIKGQVVDEKYAPVPYVNIFIKSRLTGTIADYQGEYQVNAFPGDTLTFSAVAYRKLSFIIPGDIKASAYNLDVVMETDTVGLKEVVIYPWPSTYKQFKEDFMDLVVEDPLATLDLNLPSLKDIKAMIKTPGVSGQIGLYSGQGPFSLFYDKYSKEAKSKRLYSDLLKKEKAEIRYNRAVVSRVTGLKTEEEITEFMKFCPLDVSFILDASDYDLYLAILDCYIEFAELAAPEDSITD